MDTGSTISASQRYAREVKRTGYSDLGVGSNQYLFGLDDVRALFKKFRGKFGWNAGYSQLIDTFATRNGLRVAAEQNREQVLLLR